jgi:hypothetical protein
MNFGACIVNVSDDRPPELEERREHRPSDAPYPQTNGHRYSIYSPQLMKGTLFTPSIKVKCTLYI